MNFDTKHIIQDFSAAAKDYHRMATLQQRISHKLFNIFHTESELLNNALILDGGCGTGFFAEKTKHSNKNWRIIQCDISENMLHEAARFKQPCLAADISILPIAHNSFDGIFSSLCLQWINDLPNTLKGFQEILKPNGLVAIATLVEGTLSELKDSFNSSNLKQQRVSNFASAESYIQEATEAGFEIITHNQIVEVEYFDSLIALMHSLKAIGATNKAINRPKGLNGKSAFKHVETYYEQTYRCNKTLPASYHILLMVLRRK